MPGGPPFLLRAWLAIVGAFLVAACSKRATTEAHNVAGDVRVMTIENGQQLAVVEALAAEFNRTHPGPPIVIESVSGGGASLLGDKVRTAFAAGTPPDVFQMWPGEIVGPFIDAGLLRPLDDMYERQHFADVLIPWAVRGTMRHGRRFGVPIASNGMGFWYRKDSLARVGLGPPQTYAQLESLCRALHAADIHCLSLGGKFGWSTMRLLDYFLEMKCGPQLHDRINALEESWNRPEVVAAYALLRRWVTEGWLAPDFSTVSPNDARLPFYRGDAAMVFEGDWFEAQIAREDEQDLTNFDFFLPPTDRTPQRFSAFSHFFVVARGSPHAARIEELFTWYLQPQIQQRVLTGVSWTARRNINPDPVRQPRMVIWRKALDQKETFGPTDQMFPKQVMDSWFAVQDAVVAGQILPEEAARTIGTLMDAYKASRDAARPGARARALDGFSP